MDGKLSEHPLAELVREITAAELTGVLRLARERARAAIYFETGQLVFATSNLRAHRLREVVKRNGLTDAHVAEFPTTTSDDDLAAAMIQRGLLSPRTLEAVRANQVRDVLRVALLWTDGTWEFDRRVRLADEIRVQIDASRLLLECARHLPAAFVTSRLLQAGNTYLKALDRYEKDLRPAEALLLSRVLGSATLSELEAGADEEASHRAIYALSLSGLLQRDDWPIALGSSDAALPVRTPRSVQTTAADVAAVDELADVEALFARLQLAKDYYEVLDVARLATTEEIKNAYHALARRFHPDRFHQYEARLLAQIESAFAQIAHAYETLSDESGRAHYDAKRSAKPGSKSSPKPAPDTKSSNGAPPRPQRADANRAEASFQHGLEALKLNRHEEAVRFLAEAAMLSPREARYRAHYGRALVQQTKTRRIAETELQAALALEPENAAYRVMLAELYKQLGLQKRAEGELERALAVDPKNEAARSLLVSLRSKSQKT